MSGYSEEKYAYEHWLSWYLHNGGTISKRKDYNFAVDEWRYHVVKKGRLYKHGGWRSKPYIFIVPSDVAPNSWGVIPYEDYPDFKPVILDYNIEKIKELRFPICSYVDLRLLRR